MAQKFERFRSTALKVLSAGAATGIRATAGLRHIHPGDAQPVIKGLRFAESVFDKLPSSFLIPARTHPVALLGRAAVGAYAAVCILDEGQGREEVMIQVLAAATGAAAAVASAVFFTTVRNRLGRRSRVLSDAAGFVEDVIVAGMGPRPVKATA